MLGKDWLMGSDSHSPAVSVVSSTSSLVIADEARVRERRIWRVGSHFRAPALPLAKRQSSPHPVLSQTSCPFQEARFCRPRNLPLSPSLRPMPLAIALFLLPLLPPSPPSILLSPLAPWSR